jgi:hypothetical protein
MFHKVRVLNKNGKLLKIIKSEVLSNRHWRLFEEQLKPKPGKKNKLNEFKKDGIRKDSYSLDLDSFGLEGY